MSEESRRIAEALGSDRDRWAREVRLRAERRERIATALMAGMYANVRVGESPAEHLALGAVVGADALLAELDARRDAELAEARA